MYELIKSVIEAGGYKLVELKRKIRRLYLLDELTEEEMDELTELAVSGASADAERPETLKLIQTLAEKYADLEARVKTLEGTAGERPEEPEAPEYPVWKPWDGISQDYQTGAIVSHKGQLWQSVHPGQNVWEPGTAGTQSLWQVYEGG